MTDEKKLEGLRRIKNECDAFSIGPSNELSNGIFLDNRLCGSLTLMNGSFPHLVAFEL